MATRRFSLNSSSVRNSLAYVMRAKRIASPGTGTRLSSLDTVERISKGWDAWGNRKVHIVKDYDKLQYALAYSNLDKNPADLKSLAKGRAVTAENESQRCYDWAVEQEKAAEYWEYEAETVAAEERFVSGWESWLDID